MNSIFVLQMDLQIKGNTALVTASSSGLGKASAKALARDGVNVVINGRNKNRLEDAQNELQKAGSGTVRTKSGDLTENDTIRELITFTVEEFGSLDHLVTNTAGPPAGTFLETDDRDWEEAYELLVMPVVRLAREAKSHLENGNGGTIVTITSRTVKEALENLVLSNSVRMGIIGLGKTLSREFAPDIRVNSVLPGPHETARLKELIQEQVDSGKYETFEEGKNDWSADVPLNRIGDPMELGNTVAFLSSPRSGYINGATIPIDGGSGRSNL